MGSGLIQRGCTCNDAVEIVRKALRESQALSSALRAALVIRLRRRLAVIGSRQHFCGFRCDVQRTKSEVEQLLPVQREARTWFDTGIVAGVARRCDKASSETF